SSAAPRCAALPKRRRALTRTSARWLTRLTGRGSRAKSRGSSRWSASKDDHLPFVIYRLSFVIAGLTRLQAGFQLCGRKEQPRGARGKLFCAVGATTRKPLP